jgi:cell division transport system permease protein
MEKTTSTISLFERASKLALVNIWRNKFLSLATIFVIGTIIFIFNVILIVNFIAQDSINNLSKKIDIVAYLKDSTTFEETQSIMGDLKKIDGVESVNYTSKDAALEQIRITHPDISTAFTKYSLGNPLPASISVTTKEPKYHKTVADFLNQDKYAYYMSNKIVADDSSSTETNSIIDSVSKNLVKLNNFTRQIIFWLIMTFVIGGALISLNALQVTIFSRRKEIQVMELVGASYWFIRLPFIIEGIFYGIFSMIIGLLMLTIVSANISIDNLNIFNYADTKFYLMLVIELLVTILLTISSSIIAVHEHLFRKTFR